MFGLLEQLPHGSALDALLARTAELKRELVRFALAQHIRDIFPDCLVDDTVILDEEADSTGRIESFLRDHIYPDGSRVHERFLEARSDLSPGDRDIVLGWTDWRVGVFRIEASHWPMFDVFNEVDQTCYTLLTNADAAAVSSLLSGQTGDKPPARGGHSPPARWRSRP